jgi:predicted nucleic acid-binding protein
MISEKKYLKALRLVEKYHLQIGLIVKAEKPKEEKARYKAKRDLNVGDVVECIEVHLNSRQNLTKGKTYEVVKTDDYHFYIVSDKGKKKFYTYDNSQFKALA